MASTLSYQEKKHEISNISPLHPAPPHKKKVGTGRELTKQNKAAAAPRNSVVVLETVGDRSIYRVGAAHEAIWRRTRFSPEAVGGLTRVNLEQENGIEPRGEAWNYSHGSHLASVVNHVNVALSRRVELHHALDLIPLGGGGERGRGLV